jgi:hypothetical protein
MITWLSAPVPEPTSSQAKARRQAQPCHKLVRHQSAPASQLAHTSTSHNPQGAPLVTEGIPHLSHTSVESLESAPRERGGASRRWWACG